ncbi:hypothetical protein [Natrononativus amylolyticus]|uniref:hypothetical protein n=1 Tax=Natrononativus amylolyticus TaxID=2963434 RepID=UPI0020CCA241|nr:hypothetical protein [Natrononativus amylolyticus]
MADPDWTIPDRVDVLYETDDGVVGERPDARSHLESEVRLMHTLVISNTNRPPYEHVDTREN